jgi:hypothetical protein
MNSEEGYLCPVCKKNYKTKAQADDCFRRYGKAKNKYQIGQRVRMLSDRNQTMEEIIGTIVKFEYTQPDFAPRKPHTILYLILIEAIGKNLVKSRPPAYTAAEEKEIQAL